MSIYLLLVIGVLTWLITVSYTHLDVYKRQKQTSFLGKHISSKEIKSIFNIKSVPTKSQVGMVQPFYFNLNNTIIVFCSACSFILISHLYFSSTSKNQLVYSNEINLLDNNNKEISTDVFELKGPIAPLKIFINSDVDNSWVATDFSLVNQTTSESSYFSKDIEYYHGYEGGENWTEGDTTDEFNTVSYTYLDVYKRQA